MKRRIKCVGHVEGTNEDCLAMMSYLPREEKERKTTLEVAILH